MDTNRAPKSLMYHMKLYAIYVLYIHQHTNIWMITPIHRQIVDVVPHFLGFSFGFGEKASSEVHKWWVAQQKGHQITLKQT